MSSGDKDKSGEVTHGVHEVSLATVVCDITRSPEIDMEDVERAAQSGQEKMSSLLREMVPFDRDAVRALKDPVGDVLAAQGPKETEADAVQSFVDPHMTSRGGCMVGGEDVMAKGQRDDDEHEHLLIVLNGLEDNELALKKRESVLVDVITVGSMESSEIGFRKRG